MTTIRVRAHAARRLPDPVYRGADEHVLRVNVLDYSKDIPLTAETNPRDQNLNLAVYKEAEASLLNQNGAKNSFHLLSKGILLVADSVQPVGSSGDVFDVTFTADHHGVADGGHTSQLIWRNQDVIQALMDEGSPISQFVNVHVLVGYPDEVIPEIIEARNSTSAVAQFTLLSFGGSFDWIEQALSGTGFNPHIAYRQNAPGEIDVRDVLMLADAMNTRLYPNRGTGKGAPKHPVRSYSSKQSVLNSFDSKQADYTWLSPILGDLLTLYDTIGYEGEEVFYKFKGSKRYQCRFIEERRKGTYEFPFIGKTSTKRVMRGAVMPVLASLRWFVTEDPATKLAAWDTGFGAVLDAWHMYGGELLDEINEELDRRAINDLAKDPSLWSSLHKGVLTAKAASVMGSFGT